MNKINKFMRIMLISLVGTVLFAFSPLVSHAQYYNYNIANSYNYTPLNVTTTNATNVTSFSAILNGLVNGNNLYNTYNIETWFQYGPSTNLEYSAAHINSNSSYANFSSNVSNLAPNTIYYFRAVGQNPQGVVYGSINSFRTNFPNLNNVVNTENIDPLNPTIITNPATSVSSRSAKLNSLIINSPNNPATTWFEWGTMTSLSDITPTVSLGSLSSAKHINTITGLVPGTTYYFRAVVQNSSSRINGATLSFTTSNVNPSNVAEKNTDNTVITNTSTVEPASSSLAANVFGSGSLFPISILGWLLLIILVLILIILSKHFYRNLNRRQKINTTPNADK